MKLMKPGVKSKLESVFAYPFFQSVGKPLPASVTKIDNWPAAAKMCRSQKWATCKLMARNALQRRIEARYPEDTVNHQFWHRMQEWNRISDELRPLILSFVDTLLPNIPVSEKGHKNIRAALSWEIMFICFEEEYRDVIEPLFYIPFVEPWYAAGHFPCGWDGDEFPDAWDGVIAGGQLMVY
jgi:hypothetical protein